MSNAQISLRIVYRRGSGLIRVSLPVSNHLSDGCDIESMGSERDVIDMHMHLLHDISNRCNQGRCHDTSIGFGICGCIDITMYTCRDMSES